jgi:hypothetical protein
MARRKEVEPAAKLAELRKQLVSTFPAPLQPLGIECDSLSLNYQPPMHMCIVVWAVSQCHCLRARTHVQHTLIGNHIHKRLFPAHTRQAVEEKVKEGAQNLVMAYKKGGVKADPALGKHASDMLEHATTKIEFLRTEILAHERATAAAETPDPQPEGPLALRFTMERRRAEVARRIQIEELVHQGAQRLATQGGVGGKALTEARGKAVESGSKLCLLKRALQQLTPVGSTPAPPLSAASAAAGSDRGAELSGTLTVHVVQAQGLHALGERGTKTKFRPFVVAKVRAVPTLFTLAHTLLHIHALFGNKKNT